MKCIMSSRPLCSESDGLSLPAVTRKGRIKKSSNQSEMEQQEQNQFQQHATVQISPLPDQPLRPASAQVTAGESAVPAVGQADRSSSTPAQDTGLMQPPPVNTVLPARTGTLQVSFNNNNTHDSGSHMSQMSRVPAVLVTKRFVTKKLDISPKCTLCQKHLQL